MLKILGFLLAFLTAAHAQSVQQSGTVTPGHLPYWVTNGVIGDAGTAVNSKLSSIGTVGQGPTICAASAPQTGPFNQLCLAANTGSASQISLQNFGGAPTETLQFVINGTIYTFPFVSSGAIGPGSTTIGDLTCWNNTVGTLLSDCGIPGTGLASLTVANQQLSGGVNVTSQSLGTFSGGVQQVGCGTRPLQFFTNGGAFTLSAPASDGSCDLLDTNNASAGTITFSGFTVSANTGDALTTTNTSKFLIHIERINATSTYFVKALQ